MSSDYLKKINGYIFYSRAWENKELYSKIFRKDIYFIEFPQDIFFIPTEKYDSTKNLRSNFIQALKNPSLPKYEIYFKPLVNVYGLSNLLKQTESIKIPTKPVNLYYQNLKFFYGSLIWNIEMDQKYGHLISHLAPKEIASETILFKLENSIAQIEIITFTKWKMLVGTSVMSNNGQEQFFINNDDNVFGLEFNPK